MEFVMKLNNPEKFVAGIDNNCSPLIAVCDIICQFSTAENPQNDTDWEIVNAENYAKNNDYRWIRISFDRGDSFSIKYQLNRNVEITESFLINKDRTTISDNIELVKLQSDDPLYNQYSYKYKIKITKEQYDFNCGKTLSFSLFLKSEDNFDDPSNPENETYVNIIAQTHYKKIKSATSVFDYYFEFFVTDSFLDIYQGYTLTCKS